MVEVIHIVNEGSDPLDDLDDVSVSMEEFFSEIEIGITGKVKVDSDWEH
jgi:hypothetical protein